MHVLSCLTEFHPGETYMSRNDERDERDWRSHQQHPERQDRTERQDEEMEERFRGQDMEGGVRWERGESEDKQRDRKAS
jgi:hypothetical protein